MKEIIILGMGPSREDCPFNTEVWSVNTGYRQVANLGGHLEKIFMAHLQVPDPTDNVHIFNWDEMNELAKAGVDIINTHRVKGLNSRMYPLKRISEKFNTNYFSDTIAYMIAYAIDKATYKKDGKLKLKYPLKLRLYGIDMRTEDEYAKEKGGIEFWIGYGMGLGVEFTLTSYSEVLQTHTRKPYGKKRYNLKDIDPFHLLGRKGKISKKRHDKIIAQVEELTRR